MHPVRSRDDDEIRCIDPNKIDVASQASSPRILTFPVRAVEMTDHDRLKALWARDPGSAAVITRAIRRLYGLLPYDGKTR